MAQRNVEWYSVHTNSVALRDMGHATLHHLCVRCTDRHYAESFHATLHYLCVRCTDRHYAEPFHATLHHLCVRRTDRHYAEPFQATLHRLCVRCTNQHYAELFHATLHRLCVNCATQHYPEPFHATLHRVCTILQIGTKLFIIKLAHFTISCSNSTWATRLFIIWLNYSCLGYISLMSRYWKTSTGYFLFLSLLTRTWRKGNRW